MIVYADPIQKYWKTLDYGYGYLSFGGGYGYGGYGRSFGGGYGYGGYGGYGYGGYGYGNGRLLRAGLVVGWAALVGGLIGDALGRGKWKTSYFVRFYWALSIALYITKLISTTKWFK